MKKRFYIIYLCMMLIMISGCSKNAADESTSNENTYEFLLTNDTPLIFKSIDLTFDDDEHNVILSGSVNVNETIKFSIPESTTRITVTLNPKNAYSVKKVLELKFDDDSVLQYKVVIDKNEISLKKQDKEE
ncbi:MAG: hypothetical protein K2P45_14755 [Eubacterium sp.]|nr:hypothetical protein [Eubacterium sp.]